MSEMKNTQLTDLSGLGLSESELFSHMDHSALESEKITAPRYSYWRSVFRVFFKKRINIVILTLPLSWHSPTSIPRSATMIRS